MLKKLISYLLTGILVFSLIPFASANATTAPSFLKAEGLYAQGTANEENTEAWQLWQNVITEEGNDPENYCLTDVDENTKYFFMPASSPENQAYIYNGFSSAVTINETTIQPNEAKAVSYTTGTGYQVDVNNNTYNLIFKRSSAEASVYVNNTSDDYEDLYTYLCADKENSSNANGCIVNADGTVDNTSIKKIKGRGNTTWGKNKKPFNITYSENVNIQGLTGKKFSLLANYQDASLVRNRLLFDLSDAVGMPYASDSRFVDLYINGVYYGSYQMAQKIEVGSKDVVNDIDDEAYLTDENTVATDFPFLMEIDPSANSTDYTVSSKNNTPITIASPEIEEGEVGYTEVKNYVNNKFTALCNAITTNSTKSQLEAVMDLDSFAKIFLINELGKNWDVGVSSLYLVYKQDSQGNWKFFASPVWDYDNSIGNAKGSQYDFNRMGITQEDYTSPFGWWCEYKKYSATNSSYNLINRVSKCKILKTLSAQIWYKDFVPALDVLFGDSTSTGEILSATQYYSLIEGSADCNYTRGWLLYTNSNWIADHSSLTNATYNFSTKTFSIDNKATSYPATFKGEFDYTIDWLKSRTAWLSSEFFSIADTNGDNVLDQNDTISDPTPVTVDKAVLSSATASTNSVKLSWKAMENIDGFELYQKENNGDYKLVKTVSNTVTSNTFTNLKSATTYSYKIRAYKNFAGKNYYGEFSNEISATTAPPASTAPTAPTAPTTVNLKKTKIMSPNAIKLSWEKVKDANGYTIYKKVNGKYKKVADTTKLTYTVTKLKPSKKYSFKVKSYVKVGTKKIYSVYSNTRSGKTGKATYNSKGYYKKASNVPDFAKYSNASQMNFVKTTKTKKNTTQKYTYYANQVTKKAFNKYTNKLKKLKFIYSGFDKFSNSKTTYYYKKGNTNVTLTMTKKTFTIKIVKK